jgi:hypothetical protein
MLGLQVITGLIIAWPKYGNVIATAIIAVLWALALCVVNLAPQPFRSVCPDR